MEMNKMTIAYHLSDKNFSVLLPSRYGDFGSGIYLGLDAPKLIAAYLNPYADRRKKKHRKLISIGESGFVDYDVFIKQLDERFHTDQTNIYPEINAMINYIIQNGPQSADQLDKYISYLHKSGETVTQLAHYFANKSIRLHEEDYWPTYRLYKVKVDENAKIIDMSRPLREQGFSSLSQEQLCCLYRIPSFSMDLKNPQDKQAMIKFIRTAYSSPSPFPYAYGSPEQKEAAVKQEHLRTALEMWQQTVLQQKTPAGGLTSADSEAKSAKQKKLETTKNEEQLKNLVNQSAELLTQFALDAVPSKFPAFRFDEAKLGDGKVVYDDFFRTHYLVIRNPAVVSLQSYQVVLKDDQLVEDLSKVEEKPIERPPHIGTQQSLINPLRNTGR